MPARRSISSKERIDVARQPHVLRLRHAVAAAHVAAVGDRDAEIAERPRESVRGQRPGRRSRPGSRPASSAGARPAPTHSIGAVRVELPLPDRHPALQLLDHVPAGGEGLVPVRARRPRSPPPHRRSPACRSGARSATRTGHRPSASPRFARTRLRPSERRPSTRAAVTARPPWWSRTSAEEAAIPPPRSGDCDLRRPAAARSSGALGEEGHRSALRPAEAARPSRPRRRAGVSSAACARLRGAKRLGRKLLAPGQGADVRPARRRPSRPAGSATSSRLEPEPLGIAREQEDAHGDDLESRATAYVKAIRSRARAKRESDTTKGRPASVPARPSSMRANATYMPGAGLRLQAHPRPQPAPATPCWA